MKNDKKDISFFKTKFGLILLFVSMIILSVGILGFSKKLNITSKNKKQEQAKLEFYKEEKEKIEARLSEVDSEDGIDKTARENFNLAKEGEGLVIIIEEEMEETKDIDSGVKTNIFEFFKRIFSKI